MFRFLTRPCRFVIEFAAGFVGVLVVLGVLLVWRLSMSPMSSAFLTPYVEAGIVKLVPGAQATVARSLLTWDNADRSVTLHAGGVHLASKQGAPVADIPEVDIRMSIFGLIVGRLVPAGLNIENPHVWITRDKNGALLFGGMAAQGGGGDIKGTLTNIADDLEHAHFMRRLQITDAIFDIHDETAGADWSVSIPDTVLERHLDGTLSGESKIEVTQDKNAALAVAHYTFDPGKRRHVLSAKFSGINPAFIAGAGSKAAFFDLPFAGEVSLTFDKALDLAGAAIDVHGDAGTFVYPDFWDAPRAVKNLDLKASYDRKTGAVAISDAVVDFGGPKLGISLAGAPPKNQTSPPHDLDFDLSLDLASLPMNDFAALWPKPIIPGARAWIAASLSNGTFDHGKASFKGALSWNDIDNVQITEGGGEITASGALVKYLGGMPPVVGVGADAKFDLDQMTATVSGGGIGDLKLQPSTIRLGDFEKNVQTIDLPIKIAGPLPAVLKLIDAPRFGYAKAVGLTPDSVSGNFDGMVDLKFPLLNSLLMKDVAIKVNGTLSDLASSQLIGGLDITQGNLNLDVDKDGFALQGAAALDKVPLHVSWHEAFDENSGKPLKQAAITGAIDGEQWKQLGVDALGKTQGVIAVSLQMVQKTKASTSFSGALDMKEAGLEIDDLNWKKPAGKPATLEFAAEMPEGKDIAVKSIKAAGPGVNIKGKAVLASGSLRPVSINFNSFVVGRTDAALHFTQAPGPGGKLSFAAEGKSFDVSGLRGGKDPERADPRPKEYRIKLDRLFTSENGFISNVKGGAVRDPEGWSAISLHGLADNAHPLDIDLTREDDGHRVFSARCDDFGKALKGLGFTDTVKGGKLKITGSSTPEQSRVINGKVYIGSFEVKDLPALVVLMNATSPFGLVNLFTGTLDFDRLEGKFHWHDDALALDDIRASGTSVGMTIDGKLDMNTGASELHGTVAPFSVFNRILNYIPLIGDMLTGGEGQGVLGVSYTIKGTLDKPDVSVNPVSLLTPGFLRNLFFGGGSGEDLSDETAPSSSAPVPAIEQTLPPAVTNINRSK